MRQNLKGLTCFHFRRRIQCTVPMKRQGRHKFAEDGATLLILDRVSKQFLQEPNIAQSTIQGQPFQVIVVAMAYHR